MRSRRPASYPALATAVAALSLLPVATSDAAIDSERFADPAAQERYATLVRDYTCATCSNASLADARAPAARNYRQEIRRMVSDGQSDRAIREYLEEQFPGQVLPRRGTGPLWLLAVGVAAAGVTAFGRALRGRLGPPTPVPTESAADKSVSTTAAPAPTRRRPGR